MMNDALASIEEVVICRYTESSWRVEIPHADDSRRIFVAFVSDRGKALILAEQMRPNLPIRIAATCVEDALDARG
jgi:hypothetical protein